MENLELCEPVWFHSIPGMTDGSFWCAVSLKMCDGKAEFCFCIDNKASRIDSICAIEC